MDSIQHTIEVELREEQPGRPLLRGTILQEGRLARNLNEVFAPNSVTWPSEGIGIKAVHLGAVETRAHPVRQKDGRLTIAAAVTPGLQAAWDDGRRALSVEFIPRAEQRNRGGAREILRALVDAAALVPRGEHQGTAAEIRAAVDGQDLARFWALGGVAWR